MSPLFRGVRKKIKEVMMGVMDNIAGFFTGDNKKVENQVPDQAFAYINHLVSDEEIARTLDKVSRVVEMKDWLFFQEEEGHFPYRNESLEKAIYVGQDVEEAVHYMKNGEGYQGVALNDDVLKTILTRFLTTIDVYEFTGLDFDLKGLYRQVYSTPGEMVNYIIEERQGKLDQMVQDPAQVASPDFARRLYEYDFLIQRNGEKSMGDGNRVNSYAGDHARAVFERYLNRFGEAEEAFYGEDEPVHPQEGPNQNQDDKREF